MIHIEFNGVSSGLSWWISELVLLPEIRIELSFKLVLPLPMPMSQFCSRRGGEGDKCFVSPYTFPSYISYGTVVSMCCSTLLSVHQNSLCDRLVCLSVCPSVCSHDNSWTRNESALNDETWHNYTWGLEWHRIRRWVSRMTFDRSNWRCILANTRIYRLTQKWAATLLVHCLSNINLLIIVYVKVSLNIYYSHYSVCIDRYN